MEAEKNIIERRTRKINQEAQARAILNMPAEDLDKLIADEGIDVGEEKTVAGKKELVARAKMGDEAYVTVYKPMRSEKAAKELRENLED